MQAPSNYELPGSALVSLGTQSLAYRFRAVFQVETANKRKTTNIGLNVIELWKCSLLLPPISVRLGVKPLFLVQIGSHLDSDS